MPHTFSKEAKEFEGGPGNWFGFGVHEVTIGDVTEGTTDAGTDFIEFTVLGSNEEEDTGRVWLTEKSEKYSFANLRNIYVHCAPEGKKDAAREAFDKAKDSAEIVALLEKCVGKKCWFTKYPDPIRTYTNSAGEVKKSINKNVLGYEPKLKTELIPKDGAKNDVVIEDLGGEPASGDAASNIPDDWS